MSFWKFISYKSSIVWLVLLTFVSTLSIVVVDSVNEMKWSTVLYAVLMVLVIMFIFFIIQFYMEKRSIRQFEKGNIIPHSLETEYFQDLLLIKQKEHIKELNRLRKQQYDYRDFMISWFHEVKTPISVLRLMQQTELDVNSFADEVDKIDHYVEQALYYAKLESFSEDYDIKKLDIKELVKERVKSHSRIFITKHIRIELLGEAAVVQSDKIWLRFIIDQLLTNSLKYTDHGGKISISIVEQPSEVQLMIKDNGMGISQVDLPRIFNRGYTGENGRKHAKSTGMGLYLAQTMAERLHHSISCESEWSKYTTMRIHFPKYETSFEKIIGQ